MDNDSIDKDELFTTLSKRRGENFQSTLTIKELSDRDVQAAPRIQMKVSQIMWLCVMINLSIVQWKNS